MALGQVRKLCDEAGVPRVSTHSLRGLHSTLALEAGATSSAVAAALGQVTIVRNAYDAVLGFHHAQEVRKYRTEREERLRAFGLEMDEDKTRLRRFRR